jgi:hypothetical protein
MSAGEATWPATSVSLIAGVMDIGSFPHEVIRLVCGAALIAIIAGRQ